MRNAAKIEYLSKVPLFSGFSKKDLGEVARHVDAVDVSDGTNLTEEGSIAHQFGIIVEGAAVVKRNNRKLADLGAGDFWGEMSLLLQDKSSATVSTTKDSTLLVIHSSEFAHLLDRVPALSRKLLTGLAARLLEADKKLTI